MDWHFKTIARKSCLTDKFFVPGDKIVSLIYAGDKADELGRGDLLSTEVNDFKIDGDLLGRWTCVIKDTESQAEDSSQRFASASASASAFPSAFAAAHNDFRRQLHLPLLLCFLWMLFISLKVA